MDKFKLEIFDANNDRHTIVTGQASKEDIDAAVEYLLKLKEERYENERTN